MFPTTCDDLMNSSMTEILDTEQRNEHEGEEDPSELDDEEAVHVKEDENSEENNEGESNCSENNTAMNDSVNTSMDSNISAISIDNDESSAEVCSI